MAEFFSSIFAYLATIWLQFGQNQIVIYVKYQEKKFALNFTQILLVKIEDTFLQRNSIISHFFRILSTILSDMIQKVRFDLGDPVV